MPDTIAPVTFIGGERRDTRTGKERYVVRSNDGREFSVWDRTVFDGVMEHLHEEVQGSMYSKQDERGTWWNTLSGLPDLGLASAPPSRGGTTTTPSGGSAPSADLSALVLPLERIAQALENLVTWQMEALLQGEQAAPDYPEPPGVGSTDEE
jgi:hypothetical protein